MTGEIVKRVDKFLAELYSGFDYYNAALPIKEQLLNLKVKTEDDNVVYVNKQCSWAGFIAKSLDLILKGLAGIYNLTADPMSLDGHQQVDKVALIMKASSKYPEEIAALSPMLNDIIDHLGAITHTCIRFKTYNDPCAITNSHIEEITNCVEFIYKFCQNHGFSSRTEFIRTHKSQFPKDINALVEEFILKCKSMKYFTVREILTKTEIIIYSRNGFSDMTSFGEMTIWKDYDSFEFNLSLDKKSRYEVRFKKKNITTKKDLLITINRMIDKISTDGKPDKYQYLIEAFQDIYNSINAIESL